MLKINADQTGAHCDGLSRRNFLQIGSLAMGGMALPQLLRAEAAAGSSAQRQKSVIMIYLPGGPSHTDMWDIKEGAPLEYRGEFNAINTNVAGARICEHLGKSVGESVVGAVIGPKAKDTSRLQMGYKAPQTVGLIERGVLRIEQEVG